VTEEEHRDALLKALIRAEMSVVRIEPKWIGGRMFPRLRCSECDASARMGETVEHEEHCTFYALSQYIHHQRWEE